MRRQLRFSRRAARDIENVLAHPLKQFCEQKYQEYKTLIHQALADLAAGPNRPPAKRRPELHHDARTFHIARPGKRARHFFLYRVVGNEFIDIGRLLHDAMDLQRHLPKGFDSTE
jgi:toxin ParE1/3/4